jgi:hypothetical protein
MPKLPALPRATDEDAAVRRLMGRLALVVAVLAFVLAMFGDVPKDVPAWALDNRIMYRALVALALFFVGLAFVNVIALVFHGWLFTGFSVGPAEANAEQVANQQQAGALQDAITALEKVTVGADEILSDLQERMVAVEEASGIEPPETPPAPLAAQLEAGAVDEEPAAK